MSLGGCILCISLGIYLGVGLLGHRAHRCAALVETAEWFSEVVVPADVPPAVLEHSSCSISLPAHVFPHPVYFYFSHSVQYVVISNCAFNVHFPEDS